MEGIITSLKLKSKSRRKVEVYLDGEPALTLSVTLAAGLQVGQALEGREVERLLKQDAAEAAREQALRLISRRPRSERELRQAWDRRRVSPEAQQAALEQLRQSGQVDDAAFAAAWVENRQTFRPRSSWALRTELRRKGVEEATIASSMEGFDDEQAAYQAASRMARRLGDLTEEEFRHRLSSQLERRGFSWEVVRPVVRRVWEEHQSPTGPKESEAES